MVNTSFFKKIFGTSRLDSAVLKQESTKLSRKQKKAYLARYLSPKSKLGLEIGPNINPVFAKSEGFRVEYIESVNTEGLRKRCNATGKDPTRVESIDFVFQRDTGLLGSIGKQHCYEYVVSSHLVEHIPNLVGHFSDVSTLLIDTGLYGMIIPDKKLCFDFAKPPSTLGQVLQAHVENHTSPTLAAYIDEIRYGVRLNDKGAWAIDDAGSVRAKYPNYYPKLSTLLSSIEDNDPSKTWFGHNWFFSCDSFISILNDLNILGLTDLHLIDVMPTGHMDFMVILGKESAPYDAMPHSAAIEKLTSMNYFSPGGIHVPNAFRV